jgi:subtilase family serine protease
VQVQSAFSTTLGHYEVNGQEVHLASSSLSIPSSLSGVVSGVEGVPGGASTISRRRAPTRVLPLQRGADAIGLNASERWDLRPWALTRVDSFR